MTRLDEADRERVDVVFVTTDPARDDRARCCARYLDHFDPTSSASPATSTRSSRLGKPLGVSHRAGRAAALAAATTSRHSTTVTAIDGHDDGADPLDATATSSAQFADDIHTLLERG